MKTLEDLVETLRKESYNMQKVEKRLMELMLESKDNPSSRFYGEWEEMVE